MKPRLICVALASLAGWIAVPPAAATAAESRLVAFPENSSTLTIIRDGEPYLEIALMGWEPNWKYMGLRGKVVEEESSGLLANSAKTTTGAEVSINLRARQTGPRQLTLGAEVSASKDAQLLYVVAAVTLAGEAFEGGKALADLAGGETRQVELPRSIGKDWEMRSARSAFLTRRAGPAQLIFAPPRDIPSDGAARVVLAEGRLAAGQPAKTSIVLDLAEEMEFLAGPSRIPFETGFEDWYVFAPDADHDRSSEIGMQSWLAAPAANTAASSATASGLSITAGRSSSGGSTCVMQRALRKKNWPTSGLHSTPSMESTPCGFTSMPTDPAGPAFNPPTVSSSLTPTRSIVWTTWSPR